LVAAGFVEDWSSASTGETAGLYQWRGVDTCGGNSAGMCFWSKLSSLPD